MERLLIDCPMGNYLKFRLATSILGSFTALFRGGFWTRAWRVLRTVRYYRGIQSMKNRLRLPNPGVRWLTSPRGRRVDCSNKVINIAGHSLPDWTLCYQVAQLRQPLALVLNTSCPNCPGEDRSNYHEVFQTLRRMHEPTDAPLIVKLPPVGYQGLVRLALDAGITRFQCCNTLPTPGGGLSGKALKPLSLQACRDVRNYAATRGHQLDLLIGSGGITSYADAEEYFLAGATNVAVSSWLFFFWEWGAVQKLAYELVAKPVTSGVRCEQPAAVDAATQYLL